MQSNITCIVSMKELHEGTGAESLVRDKFWVATANHGVRDYVF